MIELPTEWSDEHLRAHDCFTGAPVDYPKMRFVAPHPRLDGPARHLQIEDERLWTTSELILAAYWAGFGGIVVAVASVLLWTWWVS